jgi:DNA-binding transcriptional ArsR family regulator
MLAEQGELHVGSIVDQVGGSQPLVSYDLGILRHAGLVDTEKSGPNVYYRIAPEHAAHIGKLLDLANEMQPRQGRPRKRRGLVTA